MNGYKRILFWIATVAVPSVFIFFLQEVRHGEVKGETLGTIKTTLKTHNEQIKEIKNDIIGIESAIIANRDSWNKLDNFIESQKVKQENNEKQLDRIIKRLDGIEK